MKPLKNISLNLDQINKPRQFFNKTYTPNGVIDIYRKYFILKNKRLFGKKVLGYKTAFTNEIDTIEQLNYMRYKLKKKNGKINKNF